MRHTGHIRKRSKGSFEIRYSTGIDPLTGKWKVKTVTVRGTIKTAEKELRRLLNSIDSGEYIEPTKITVREFLKQWLETVQSQLSVKTHESYTEVVNRFLTPAFGGYMLSKLTPAIIQQAYNGWEKGGRSGNKEGGLSARTRLYIHRILKSALKHALQLQLIGRNPADAIKAPRIKKTAITTLNLKQSAVLLNSLQHTKLYWPVLLAITTGMRRGEILGLRWKNVDFEKKTVRVVESLEQSKKGIRLKAPKTERTRAVVLPDYAVEALLSLKEKQAQEFKELNLLQTQESFVCSRYDNKPLRPLTITHHFAEAIKKLPQLPKVRFHDLRHSHATQLLTAGIHPKIAQERLGHSTITTTLDLYSHVTTTMQTDAVERLNTAFRSVLNTKPSNGPKLG